MTRPKCLLFDLETNGFLRHKDPKKVADRIHCGVVVDVDDAEERVSWGHYAPLSYGGHVDWLVHVLDTADVLIGHNILGFDLPILAKFADWTPRPEVRIYDTFILSSLIYSDLKDRDFVASKKGRDLKGQHGNHSLKAWGIRLGEEKAEYEGGFEEFSQEMLDYCIQDVKTNLRLWKQMEPKLPPEACVLQEHRFADVLRRQEDRGVLFDHMAAAGLHGRLCKRRQEIDVQLNEELNTEEHKKRTIVDRKVTYVVQRVCPALDVRYKTLKTGKERVKRFPFNAGSRDHIAKFFEVRYGWKPEKWTEGGKPVVDEKVLAGLEYPEAKLLAESLLVQKRLGQLAEGNQALLKKIDDDGRIRGRIHHNGTLTGRCSHTSPNLGQVPRVGQPYGEEFRSLFTVPAGYVLVGADASGLELRMLGHFLARYDRGRYRDALLEGDIHSQTQEWAGLETRNQAKTFTYATLYGAGDGKIGSIVGGGVREGKRLKLRFYKAVPAFARLMDDLTAAWIRNGCIKGLDGRTLRPRKKNSLLNTLLQSAGAVVMKRAVITLDEMVRERGICARQILMVHDEVQYEAKEGVSVVVGEGAVEAIVEAGEYYNLRCPLDGEYKIGKTWFETH